MRNERVATQPDFRALSVRLSLRHELPVDAAHQGSEQHRFAGRWSLAIAFALALGRRRVREHAVRRVHYDLGQFRHHQVHDLRHHAQLRRDALRLADDRVGDHVGRLVRIDDRRHLVVELGRRDHRRAHERHVDDREMHVLVVELGRRAAREGLERRLRRDVRREARRIRQHADRRDVDDVAVLARGHRGQQVHRQAHAREIIELHRALEVAEPVVGQRERAADRATGVVDQHVDVTEFLEDGLGERVVGVVVGDVG